jgi:hypothetical protein
VAVLVVRRSLLDVRDIGSVRHRRRLGRRQEDGGGGRWRIHVRQRGRLRRCGLARSAFGRPPSQCAAGKRDGKIDFISFDKRERAFDPVLDRD